MLGSFGPSLQGLVTSISCRAPGSMSVRRSRDVSQAVAMGNYVFEDKDGVRSSDEQSLATDSLGDPKGVLDMI